MPETPEGAALELTRVIVQAETGNPIDALTEHSKPARANNQDVRTYILDTYAECLVATKGERHTSSEDGGRPRRRH